MVLQRVPLSLPPQQGILKSLPVVQLGAQRQEQQNLQVRQHPLKVPPVVLQRVPLSLSPQQGLLKPLPVVQLRAHH